MMKQSQSNSYLFGGNAAYVEELYEAYLDNPASVPENWRDYFDALQNVHAVDGSASNDIAHRPIIESFAQRARSNSLLPRMGDVNLATARKQVYVQALIDAYRFMGVRWANLDPLKRLERPSIPALEPAFYDFTEADMDQVFHAGDLFFGFEQATLREIVQALRDTYCGTLGVEFMYISDPEQKQWWKQRLESIRATPKFSAEKKKHILER